MKAKLEDEMKNEVEYQIKKNPEIFKDLLTECPKEILIESYSFTD
jgi:hypothetical protein